MFSVIIPVYNHKRYLREAVESALGSSLVQEILVIDDGSTDGSAELVQTISQQYGPLVKLLPGGPAGNMGAHERLNQLCHAAAGPWIAVLNSDDQFCANRFDLVHDIARIQKSNFVAGTMLIIDESSSIIGTKRGHFEPEYPLPFELQNININKELNLFKILCSQNIIASTSNMLFTKDLYRKLGGFRDLRWCHDWDFALRACLEGKAIFSAHPLTKYRAHATNTIKDPSPHVDGEVVRLFAWLLEEYPWIDKDPSMIVALGSNRHLGHYVRDCDIGRSATEARDLTDVCFSNGSRAVTGQTDEEDGIISLSSKEAGYAPRALANAALCLAQEDYDFVFLSETLEELPFVYAESVKANVIGRAIKDPLASGLSIHARRGRLVRHVPAFHSESLQKIDLRTLPGFEDVRWEGADIIVGAGLPRAFTRITARPLNLPTLPAPSGRPRCLVFPIFMALGGVERNTVEILRALKNKYDFLVVTSERLAAHQSSLHHQLDEIEVPCLDLAEVANIDRHIVLLEAIKESFRPDVVYICNGSPWLAGGAAHFRRVFGKTAIIDQQVYDTDVGWVQYYTSRGIQSFDRFIAANEGILRKFLSDFRIPKNRVDFINSCINADRLRAELAGRERQLEKRRGKGIADNQHVFACIGRLTPQKRPLDFLDLACRARDLGYEDHFMLVGDGELGEACDEYIASNRLHNVSRLRRYDHSGEVMNLIDGLVILSAFEGLPIAMLETLAFGKPALATDVGDIALVLNEYKSGIIIGEWGNAELNWRSFIEFRERLTEFSENAMRRRGDILDRFSAETIAQAYDRSWSMAMRQIPK
jgi:glycosyltransferase involved in cell wall biosynthesis/GT2 family glycosyltransferase